MLGIVLAAHGEVAPALLKAAEAIVGPLDGVRAITLEAGTDPALLRKQVEDAIRDANEGAGVLVLCDMFGGTPSNVCLSCERGFPVEVVTGVNLPMVLKVASVREGTPLEEAASLIAAYGQRHIAHATELMRERRRQAEAAASASASASSNGPANVSAHAAGAR